MFTKPSILPPSHQSLHRWARLSSNIIEAKKSPTRNTKEPRFWFGYKSDGTNLMITRLASANQFKVAEDLLDRMRNEKCHFTEEIFLSIFTFSEPMAVPIGHMMSSNGIEPNVVTFSSLMDGLCKVGRSSQAIDLLEKMIRKRLLPNMITYSSLIHGLCKEGNLQGAVDVLDRMKLQDLKPDAGLYGKLINGFCESSKFQDAANFLDEMVLGGVSPNRVTWTLHVKIHNMVVQGLCTENDLKRAFQTYMSMRTRGISINFKTFNFLVGCFCKKGDVHKAARIVSEMVRDGCIPDEDTWNAVVDGVWCRKKAREAADLLQDELMGESMEPKI